MKKIVMAVLALALLAPGAGAGKRDCRTFQLFYGANTDSTEQASPWFPIKGARRVVFRTYSGKTAFSSTSEADSAFSDSIATWKTLFSDSVSFLARDSSGTLVTARTGSSVGATPICADSVVITGAGADSLKGVAVQMCAVNKTLRAPANGSGILTHVFPCSMQEQASTTDGSGVIQTGYCRVRVTPLRRLHVTGGIVQDNLRVNGLRKFTMYVTVYYDNE